MTKDPAGDVLAGAAFILLDFEGKEAASGKTNADGRLDFEDLVPGVYRLKEVSSGSRLYDTAGDRDVIVTPGTDTPLTIIDPFKPALLLLQAKDGRSGKMLAGVTVNIGSGDKMLLTLTTSAGGTATAKLPLHSRTGTDFWVTEIKAPVGYDLFKEQRDFEAKPGDSVTVTFINAESHTDAASPAPSGKPTHAPTDTPPPGKPGHDSSPTSSKTLSQTPTAAVSASNIPAPSPSGTLASTGADSTPWLLSGAGLLIATGGGTLVAARRRRTDDSDENNSHSG